MGGKRMTEVERRLHDWAQWCLSGKRHGPQGYPSHSATEGVLEDITTLSVGPLTAQGSPTRSMRPADALETATDEEATEAAVVWLRQRYPGAADAIIAYYLGRVPARRIRRAEGGERLRLTETIQRRPDENEHDYHDRLGRRFWIAGRTFRARLFVGHCRLAARLGLE